MQKTFSIIKPDAVEGGHTGAILALMEAAGFRPVAMRLTHLTRAQAEGFYAEHRERPFFAELCDFMTRSPVVILALAADNAVPKLRDLMGATDPAKAEEGTLRKRFGSNVGENAVHGSDSETSAARELAYFFASSELLA